MKPYPRYKSTGLPWLPSVPEHWEVVKLRHILSPVSEKNHAEKPLLSVVREKGVILRDTENKEENHNFIPDDLSNYKLVREGQFAMNKMKAWQGSYGVSSYEGIVSPAYFVFDVHGVGKDFFHTAIRSAKYVAYFAQSSDGIRVGQWDLSIPRMKEIPFLIPPPSEQSRIVRYLDKKTAAIDELVRAKEREIELLREMIVWHAEDAMRTSEMKRFRLKRFVRQIADEIIVNPSQEYYPLGVLNRGRGLFHKEPVLGADLGDSTFFHVYPGDMIISGQFAWEGAVAMLEESERGCIASHRYPLVRSASEDLRLEFLWAFFQTHYGDMVLNLHSHGAAGRNRPLNFGELLDEYIPIPSIDRQSRIVDLVQRLSLLRRTSKEFKARMTEFKTRLVSDAVTGAVEID